MPVAGGLGCITGVDDGTYAFTNPVSTQAAVAPPSYASGSGLYEPYFINAQITNDQHVSHYNSPSCCATRMAEFGHAGVTITTSNTTNFNWTPTNNPFNECGDLIFTGDVIIAPGVHLFVTDMIWNFGPTAHLIIQPGASVKFIHSTLTNEECLGERWPGVIVEGNSAIHDQFNSHQGWITLTQNSVVRRAVTGIWAGHEFDMDHGGGVIKAYNSSFENNIRDVRIEHFHRIVGGVEQINWCQFSSCTFWTTMNWPDAGSNSPLEHAYLYDVNGVKFQNCKFTNEAFPLWNHFHWGMGIAAFSATFTCDGYQNYAQNYFRHLTSGIFIVYPSAAFT
jgi:hypothetical protein